MVRLLVILFFSYLSLPNIFNKNQISVELKKNLLDKLNLEFNFEKKLDYKFLPRPHFLTSESSLIFNENKISEINKLKIYVSLESLFSLKNMKIKNVKIEKANFNLDRKSTRLNSSHGYISYAVFCLKKKKQIHENKSISRNQPPKQNNKYLAMLKPIQTITLRLTA